MFSTQPHKEAMPANLAAITPAGSAGPNDCTAIPENFCQQCGAQAAAHLQLPGSGPLASRDAFSSHADAATAERRAVLSEVAVSCNLARLTAVLTALDRLPRLPHSLVNAGPDGAPGGESH